MKKLVVFLVILIGLVAHSTFAAGHDPSIEASNQATIASTIILDKVDLDEDGFVVVHAYDMAGELVLTPPLGLVYLAAGDYTDVVVGLNASMLKEYGYEGTLKDVLPMLHVDANHNEAYEFPEGGDVPVMIEGEMVVASITLGETMMHSEAMMDSDSDMMSSDKMEMDSDMMSSDMMMTPKVIYATANPADIDNDAIYGLTPDLSEAFLTFNGFAEGVKSLESIAFAADGTAYMTIDTADGGSLVGVPDLGNMAESMMLSDGEMMMMGGLKAPKGLQVVDELGLVIVADFGAKAIVVFDRDLNMMGSVSNLGGDRSIWDVYHDTASNTLYAAGTDGVLLAYDGFATTMGADGPSRMIIPSDAEGNKISVNLHGVAYYAANDELILTDVGDAKSAEDGQLFVMTNASTSEGNQTVSVQIGGPASMLGNPVDVVFDGTYAYVAEKSNDMVLRFDNLLSMDMMGMMGDAAPSLMIEVTKAESVALPASSMMDMGM